MRCAVLTFCLVLLSCGSNGGGTALDVSGDDVDVGGEAGSDAVDVDSADKVEAKPAPAYSPVVFTVVSDIHIDSGLDGSVSMKVAALLENAAKRTPAPEFIAITGDLTDRMPEPIDTAPGSPIHTAATLFAESPVPVEATLGNHDYYTPGEGIFGATEDGPAREAVFKEMLGIDPWYYTVHGETRFVYLNSLQGEEWKESLGLNGSMGQEQLDWLDALLSDGVASVLFVHHPPSTVLEGGERAFESLVSKHADTVLAVFVGHIHVWGESEIDGVPVYLTEAGYDGVGVHHVRVDAAAGTVEILNSEEIDYGEVEEYPCDPGEPPQVSDPTMLAGSIIELRIPDALITPMGLGSYLRNTVGSIPLVLQLGSGTKSGIPALIASGSFAGEGSAEAPAYVKSVKDGPCVVLDMALDGACLETSPVTLAVDVARMLNLPLPSGWRVRAELRDLVLSGVLAPGPTIEQGVLTATIDLNLAVEDVERIIVLEYCNGTISKCKPGTGKMPACPDEPGAEFFGEVPEECDVNLLGLGLRMLFSIFASVPGLQVQVAANFSTWVADTNAAPAPGAVAPDLFATLEQGGTCPSQ